MACSDGPVSESGGVLEQLTRGASLVQTALSLAVPSAHNPTVQRPRGADRLIQGLGIDSDRRSALVSLPPTITGQIRRSLGPHWVKRWAGRADSADPSASIPRL